MQDLLRMDTQRRALGGWGQACVLLEQKIKTEKKLNFENQTQKDLNKERIDQQVNITDNQLAINSFFLVTKLNEALFVRLFVCLSVHLSIHSSVHRSVCPSIRLYVHLFVHPSVCPSGLLVPLDVGYQRLSQ